MLKEGEEAFLTATTGTGSGHVSLVDGVPSLSYPFSFVSGFFSLDAPFLSLPFSFLFSLEFSLLLPRTGFLANMSVPVHSRIPNVSVYSRILTSLLISGNKRNIVIKGVVSWVSGHKRNTVEEWFSATSSVNVRTQTELSDWGRGFPGH